MVYVIIEPHYDDAWLSLGNFILGNPKKDFKIISISTSKFNYKNETAKLSKRFKNIQTVDIAFPDLLWSSRRLPDPINLFEHVSIQKNYIVSYSQLGKSYEQIIEKIIYNISENDILLFPIGIQHPMHVICSAIGKRLSKNYKVWWYLDNPYAYKKKFHNLTREVINFLELEYKTVWDYKENNNKKTKIFMEYYQSQLFFQKGFCEKNPEYIFKTG